MYRLSDGILYAPHKLSIVRQPAALSFGPCLKEYVSFHTHNSFGDKSFSAAGPRVWNALPTYLRQDMNYRHFKQPPKGHVFRL